MPTASILYVCMSPKMQNSSYIMLVSPLSQAALKHSAKKATVCRLATSEVSLAELHIKMNASVCVYNRQLSFSAFT